MYRPLPSIGSKSRSWVVGWMYQVDVYLRVRRAVMVDGMSIREASRELGLYRDTVRKMLACSALPGYRRRTPPRASQAGADTGVIDRILADGLRPPREAAPHGQPHLRAAQGRAQFRWRIHHGQGLRKGAPPVAGDVRAVVPSAGPRPLRLRGSPGGHWRSVAEWSGRPTASSWTCVTPPGRLWVCPARRPGGGTSDAKGA